MTYPDFQNDAASSQGVIETPVTTPASSAPSTDRPEGIGVSAANESDSTAPLERVIKKKTSTTKKNKKWTRPADKPKRPLSAYNIFFSRVRHDILQQQGSGFTNLTRAVADQWNSLPEAEKAPYKHQAAINKRRYAEDLAVWTLHKEQERNRHWRQGELPSDSGMVTAPIETAAESDDVHLDQEFAASGDEIIDWPNDRVQTVEHGVAWPGTMADEPRMFSYSDFPPEVFEPRPLLANATVPYQHGSYLAQASSNHQQNRIDSFDSGTTGGANFHNPRPGNGQPAPHPHIQHQFHPQFHHPSYHHQQQQHPHQIVQREDRTATVLHLMRQLCPEELQHVVAEVRRGQTPFQMP